MHIGELGENLSMYLTLKKSDSFYEGLQSSLRGFLYYVECDYVNVSISTRM